MTRRLGIFKAVLWFLFGMGAALIGVRLLRGLGVVTALSDVTPWGLWKGLNVFAGIAIGAGGFVLAAIAHVFHGEKYHPVARCAVLIALCAYSGAAISLFYEIGMPWKIWGPIVFWNPHSPLFEVAWCVMLYLNVLLIEFAPTVLELTHFHGLYRLALKLQLPAVILGIMISTLHQSTLGTLFLIMPERLNALWYTPSLPELFFVSAIACGLAAVIFVTLLVDWLYLRPHRIEMLAGLARYLVMVLSFYLIFRLGDMCRHGKLGLIGRGNLASWMFFGEILASCLIPILLFAASRWRRQPWVLWIGSSLCILGIVFNRLNASGIAMIWATDSHYFPAWTEFAVSFGLISAMVLAFLWMHEHEPVRSGLFSEVQNLRRLQIFQLPRPGQPWAGDLTFGPRRTYSLLFVLAAILGLALTPWHPLVRSTSVQRARGKNVLLLGYPTGTVHFPHADHIKRLGQKACATCHHLHRPGDTGTPCSSCHRDMYLPTKIFHHSHHIKVLGGNSSCEQCHPAGLPASARSVRPCSFCHRTDMMTSNTVVTKFDSIDAPGYRKAAHTLCIACHRKEAKNPKWKKPDLFRCATCHRTPVPHGIEVLRSRARPRTTPAPPM